MRCAVKGCKNDNEGKASTYSFFRLPNANPMIRKQWISFCGQNREFITKNLVICLEHFKPEDIANKMEYEMGFSKKRLLNPDAVPTIKNFSIESESICKEHQQKFEKQENRRPFKIRLREHEKEHANPISVEDLVEIKMEEPDENETTLVEVKIEEPEDYEFVEVKEPDERDILDLLKSKNVKYLITQLRRNYGKYDIEQILKQIEFLRKENAQLKQNYEAAQRKHQEELNELEEKMEREMKMQKFNINSLETKLTRAYEDIKNLEEKLSMIFTKDQIEKLKSNTKN